ncbi:ankyrin repeat domain-containing protein [Paludibaculum fermentans]|uniref:ankyrin repeat domain-containing protein n=1 Tax=Paludibaculum fermentans TaxID=1473598 RepID=UPI003EBE6F17
MPESPLHQLERALSADDLPKVEALLAAHPGLLNAPRRCPVLLAARSVATAERLLSLGAQLEPVSQWWAGGMGTLRTDSSVGRLLVERGARLTVHAAAGLGLLEPLAQMLDATPALIDAKGMDSCTPLHFARTVETAQLLLSRGARIDARDEDHSSTPAQWLIGDAPEVARFLLAQGASPDIFLAAALGDRTLAESLLKADPGCVAQRIGRPPAFPPLGQGRGGTIYQWTLAFNSYPHQIALMKGHPALFDLLYERSGLSIRLIVSCLLGRRSEAEALAAAHPGLVASLAPEEHELVARYCWETNLNVEAVRLMLDVGFPLAHPERSHGYTPLHNAAWAGSADLVDLLLERGHPVDIEDPAYHATPLGYALHDCLVEKRHPEGDFVHVVAALLEAGSPWEALDYPLGDSAIDEVFRARLHTRVDGAALLGDEAAMLRLLQEEPGPDALAKALAGAAKGGHVELCRRLLELGAPVDAVAGRSQLTPLMYAASASAGPVVALLLQRGASVAVKNRNGSTVLHLAVANDPDLETVRLLLDAGAGIHVDSPNAFGHTPAKLAEKAGRQDLVELLRSFPGRDGK